MAQEIEKNIFPIYLSVERVEENFIMQPYGEKKQLVTKDYLNNFLGKLMKLQDLKEDNPVVIRIEALAVKDFNRVMAKTGEAELLEEKILYADHLFIDAATRLKKTKFFLFDDQKYLQLLGEQVNVIEEVLEKQISLKPQIIDGHKVITLDRTNDNLKILAKVIKDQKYDIEVIMVSESQLKMFMDRRAPKARVETEEDTKKKKR